MTGQGLPAPYYDDGQGMVIYHADCRDIVPYLESPDLVLADPPYGINYQHGDQGKGRWGRRNIIPTIGDDAPFDPTFLLTYPNVILWGADHYAQQLPHGRWLIWDKLGGLPSFDDFSDVEVAWHSKRGANRLYSCRWKGICRGPEHGQPRWHPAQKPVALLRWCIEQAGNPQTILDPFMGSGTTLLAARTLGRKSIGIEISQEFCALAVQRLQQQVLPFPIQAAPAPEQAALFAEMSNGGRR